MSGIVDTVKGYYKGLKDWGDQSVQESKAIAEKGKNIDQYKASTEPKSEAKSDSAPKESAPSKRDTSDTEKYIQGLVNKKYGKGKRKRARKSGGKS